MPRYDWAALWEMAHPDDGLGPWIAARWGRRCAGCGRKYEAGDLIRFDEGEGGYLAECCGQDPA